MSNRFEWEPERAGEQRSSTSMVHLLGQMLMLPFNVFVYGMEMFVRTIKGMQKAADQEVEVEVGRTSQVLAGVTADDEYAPDRTTVGTVVPPPVPQTGWSDLRVQTKNSTSGRTVEEAAEANQKEIVKMPDKNLSDDQLKLVRYKILFVKRDYEVAFPEREELVYDNMTGEAFTAWKVAEFIQRLGEEPIPYRWRKRDYPRAFTDEEKDPAKQLAIYIDRLDEHDKKYLRVFYEVLERYVREEDEDDEVTVLKDIRKAIDRLPRIHDGKSTYVVSRSSSEKSAEKGTRTVSGEGGNQ
jgi:hypothetical protein